MDAVTYSSAQVIDFIHRNAIPLRLAYDHKPLADAFKVERTPCLVILDQEGNEHHRANGFLAPEELIAVIRLGMAKTLYNHQTYDLAIQVLEELLEEHPRSDSSSEAIYVRGLCRYKRTHDSGHLKETYQQLALAFPKSEWTMRAYHYRLL
jgi:hypothetical protein